MTLAEILLAVSAATMFGFGWRLDRERLARHVWKGFRTDPLPQGSWTLFDSSEYTPAGRRLLPWFTVSYAVTVLLGLFVVASHL